MFLSTSCLSEFHQHLWAPRPPLLFSTQSWTAFLFLPLLSFQWDSGDGGGKCKLSIQPETPYFFSDEKATWEVAARFAVAVASPAIDPTAHQQPEGQHASKTTSQPRPRAGRSSSGLSECIWSKNVMISGGPFSVCPSCGRGGWCPHRGSCTVSALCTDVILTSRSSVSPACVFALERRHGTEVKKQTGFVPVNKFPDLSVPRVIN